MEQEYLYHYTTLESLELILKNRTIKFSPLDKLDDLTEGISQDAEPYRRFVYISCWTDEDKESIPMWKMYTKYDAGIRIKLKKYPFKKYDWKKYVGILEGFDSMEDDNPNRSMLLPAEKVVFGDCIPFHLNAKEDYLFKVEYTDDKTLLNPRIIAINETNAQIDIGILGRYKSMSWRFQEEWRYILHLQPWNAKAIQNPIVLFDQNYENSITFFALDIDGQAFENMEVTLCPNITKENDAFVQKLKEKFNPTMEIKHSSLEGKIR